MFQNEAKHHSVLSGFRDREEITVPCHCGRGIQLSLIHILATAYVEILRSTPVIVQVFIIYYGVFSIVQLPNFQMFGFIKFNRFFPGVVALGMNSGAYLCEIIRSGIPVSYTHLESSSITTQRSMLRLYAKEHHLNVIDEYIRCV